MEDRAGIGREVAGATEQNWQDHRTVLEQFETGRIDQELALKNKKELIFFIMLVPVKLALHYAQPDNRVIYLT